VLAAAVLAACDPFPADYGVAVTADSSGDIEVHHVLCGGERINSVTLFLAHGTIVGDASPGTGDEPDEILWRIHRIGPSHQTAFRLGEPASGFVTDVPLTRSPGPDDELSVEVDATYAAPGVTFRASELRPGVFLDGHEQRLSKKEFMASIRTNDPCPA
jgi:hypothetical protein